MSSRVWVLLGAAVAVAAMGNMSRAGRPSSDEFRLEQARRYFAGLHEVSVVGWGRLKSKADQVIAQLEAFSGASFEVIPAQTFSMGVAHAGGYILIDVSVLTLPQAELAFWLGHEWGHQALGHQPNYLHPEGRSWRTIRSPTEEEDEADAFAGRFLCRSGYPVQSAVRSLLDTPVTGHGDDHSDGAQRGRIVADAYLTAGCTTSSGRHSTAYETPTGQYFGAVADLANIPVDPGVLDGEFMFVASPLTAFAHVSYPDLEIDDLAIGSDVGIGANFVMGAGSTLNEDATALEKTVAVRVGLEATLGYYDTDTLSSGTDFLDFGPLPASSLFRLAGTGRLTLAFPAIAFGPFVSYLYDDVSVTDGDSEASWSGASTFWGGTLDLSVAAALLQKGDFDARFTFDVGLREGELGARINLSIFAGLGYVALTSQIFPSNRERPAGDYIFALSGGLHAPW